MKYTVTCTVIFMPEHFLTSNRQWKIPYSDGSFGQVDINQKVGGRRVIFYSGILPSLSTKEINSRWTQTRRLAEKARTGSVTEIAFFRTQLSMPLKHIPHRTGAYPFPEPFFRI